MMSGNLKVTFGSLDGASADINSGANKIESRLDALESDLAPLRSDWTGEAQGAYTTAKAKWDAAIGDMKALLAEIGGAVAQSNSEYQSAEAQNRGRWG
jgi:early secretory antigenic target protein ESAT-6